MKSLRQSLIDYEMVLLNGIADCWAISLTASGQVEAVDELAQALLSPVAIAIFVEDLSRTEKEALKFLLGQGGEADGPRFTRQYGAIRQMGPARLERERPWENPANPAEGLWFRGLIFKTFHVTEQGGQEVVYIPDDLLSLLAPGSPQTQPHKTFAITHTLTPSITTSGEGRLRENFFSLLVYLQTNPVRLQKEDKLPPNAIQALTQWLLPPLHPASHPEDELDFLVHLGQRAELLTVAHNRLRPKRDAIRNWLQADPIEQVQLLQNTWRVDPTWNDLWHVPGLVPQSTGWENSPLRARSKIMGYLEQLEVPVGEWLSIDDFVSRIKVVDPDFQRPGGDYDSWYIKDAHGNFLMGFEHWDEVDGQLIRYFLTHILLWLGVVDVGCKSETSDPSSFRITPLGEAFLTNRSLSSQSASKPAFLRVDNSLSVRVSAHVSLYDRFQLARFAELERREGKRVLYRITRASISRALKNGVLPDQIMAFLTRATNNQIPLKAVEAVRTWGARHATAKLEQATLLRLQDEKFIAELQQHPDLGPLLGEALGPTTIVIPADNVRQVRQLLMELGYLDG